MAEGPLSLFPQNLQGLCSPVKSTKQIIQYQPAKQRRTDTLLLARQTVTMTIIRGDCYRGGFYRGRKYLFYLWMLGKVTQHGSWAFDNWKCWESKRKGIPGREKYVIKCTSV